MFEDQSLSSELFRMRSSQVTGHSAGVLLAAVGLALTTTRSRGRPLGALMVVAWVVALGALACGLVTLALFVDQPNGASGGPSIEFGLAVAAVSPAVALFGVALVQTARARERAVASELAPDAPLNPEIVTGLPRRDLVDVEREARQESRPAQRDCRGPDDVKGARDPAGGPPISGPRPPRRVVPIEVRSLGCSRSDPDSRPPRRTVPAMSSKSSSTPDFKSFSHTTRAPSTSPTPPPLRLVPANPPYAPFSYDTTTG